MAKKKGQTPPRAARMQARGRPGQITPTADRAKRRRRANLITAAVLFVIVGAAVTAAVITATSEDRRLRGLSTATAPWPAETTGLSRRVASLDLPPVREGAGAFHSHVHLDVFIDGQRTPIPSDIGRGSAILAAIHTHDDSGIIHVEADSRVIVTLGMVFDIWGVRMTSTCVGAYCEDQGTPIELYVNGNRQRGTLRDYELQDLDQIALVIGAPPDEIPETYDFSTNPVVNPPTPTPTGSATAAPSPTGT